MTMTNDVEKRWNARATSRCALVHAGVSIAFAAIVAALALVWMANRPDTCHVRELPACTDTERFALAIVPAAVLLVGGLSALVRAYRAWKNQRPWPIWQGVAWGLLTLMTIYLLASMRFLMVG
jgi:hypothetical protein